MKVVRSLIAIIMTACMTHGAEAAQANSYYDRATTAVSFKGLTGASERTDVLRLFPAASIETNDHEECQKGDLVWSKERISCQQIVLPVYTLENVPFAASFFFTESARLSFVQLFSYEGAGGNAGLPLSVHEQKRVTLLKALTQRYGKPSCSKYACDFGDRLKDHVTLSYMTYPKKEGVLYAAILTVNYSFEETSTASVSAPTPRASSNDGSLTTNQRSRLNAYGACTRAAAKRFASSRDRAPDVAASAVYSCESEKRKLVTSLQQTFGFKYIRALLEAAEERFRREAQAIVSDIRSKRAR